MRCRRGCAATYATSSSASLGQWLAMAMIDSSVRFLHRLRVSVDGGVGGGDGCSGGAAESGGPGPDPRVGPYVCVVGGGEGWGGERSTGHERGRKRKRKEDRASRHAVSAVMRCHLHDTELSELGTVVGDGDDGLVRQVLAIPDNELSELGTVVGDGDDRLVGQVLAFPARVSGGWRR